MTLKSSKHISQYQVHNSHNIHNANYQPNPHQSSVGDDQFAVHLSISDDRPMVVLQRGVVQRGGSTLKIAANNVQWPLIHGPHTTAALQTSLLPAAQDDTHSLTPSVCEEPWQRTGHLGLGPPHHTNEEGGVPD